MRLIDADALLLKKYGEGETDSYEVVDVDDILDAPTVDAVEVVRCRDCKRHYDSKFGYVVCVWFNKTVRADGYCSYGCKMDAEVEDG